jgi:endo-1,4-beta-xylanase
MRQSCAAAPRHAVVLALAAVLLLACVPGGDVTTGVGGSGGTAGGPSGSGGAAGGMAGAGDAGASGTAGTGGGVPTGSAGEGGVAGAAGATGAAGTVGVAGQGGAGGRGGTTGGAGAAGTGTGAGGTTGAAGRGGATGAAGRGGAGGTGGRGGSGGTGIAGTSGGGAPPPLKKFVGNIDTRGQVRSDFVMYWDQFSPENAGKWGSIERTRDQMSWSSLDAMHSYAVQNNIPFKQHTFVWGSQQPSWIGSLSQADQRAEVEEWIRLYCERYPDTRLIDVVNEPPPHTTPAYVAALGGAGASGYDWIVQAFKWAHQYCPNAVLMLNDYNNIEYANDNNRTIDIVTRIKNAGAPIHGVGAQAHACANLSASTVQMYIDKIATQTGLPVYITEYDLNIADDNQQKNVMQSQFTMFWNNPNVKGITIWGYIVGSTWVANSGLMTSSGSMRPAMTWLMDFLGR